QLSWFVLEVIVRGWNHLPITLVEVDTLALAALSLPLFLFWWNKPVAPNTRHIFYLKEAVPAVPQDAPNTSRFVINAIYQRQSHNNFFLMQFPRC
ncbi:hypothetical protein PAXINDRAFT_90216, partial [Paxillus involutus ATCC 200175]